jgi:protein-S-isoprenylcysteine O-methyltransferase Ste14
LLYGVVCYAIFLGVFIYTVGFIGGFLTPTQLDGPATGSFLQALMVNTMLVLLFGLQHSVMARPAFKKWWTQIVPQPIERSTYVLATNLVLGLMFWQWKPMGGEVWDVSNALGRSALWTLYGVGWLTVLATTFLINHFDLFGLRHVWLYFRGQAYTTLPFVTPGPYRYIRHPLYVGWMAAFWATPTMTFAHFLFAAGMTAYILTAIPFEERDLIAFHGGYAGYRRRVPMFLPRLQSFDNRHEELTATGPIEYSMTKPEFVPSQNDG